MEAPNEICEIFTCPICRNTMASPIHMCVMGHSFCGNCYFKLPKCPTCRDVVGSLRNYAMERIQKNFIFPCSNSEEGCTAKKSTETIREHETYCDYAIVPCPYKNDDCRWGGYTKDVPDHCMRSHPTNSTISSTNTFQCNKDIDGKCCKLYFNAYGKNFLGLWNFVIAPKKVNWCVLYLGPPIEAEKYYFTLAIENRDDPSSSYIVKGNCHSSSKCDASRNFHININGDHLDSMMQNDSFYYTVSLYDHDVSKETIATDRVNVPSRYIENPPMCPKWGPIPIMYSRRLLSYL